MSLDGGGAGRAVGDRTLAKLFEWSAGSHTDRPAQRYKGGTYDRSLAGVAVDPAPAGEYAAISYGEMRDVVRRLATGFRELGIRPGDRVGLFAGTRMEWAQSDFALLAAGAVVTTVYKSSSPAQARHLLADPEATAVVVESDELLERVLAVEDEVPVEQFVVMDDTDSDREDVHSLADVYELGDAAYDETTYRSWLDERDPDDLASLVYTSGTTGQPKGVRLTHRNFAANAEQVGEGYGPDADLPADAPRIDETTQTVSYLPLAHVFERLTGHFFIFDVGGCVAYAESVDTLKEDFQLVQPTAATSVPRVYEKIYDAVREEAEESAVGQHIFEWAVDIGRRYHREELPGVPLRTKYALADTLVFSKVRSALGGNVEMLVSGGGTLSKELAELYHGMGLPIYEGYGLTEAAPVVTTNPVDDPKVGTIGTALPALDWKLDTHVLPEENLGGVMGDTGELLVQGPNVTDGYWNVEQATTDAFTDDGYFRTGDIVTQRPDGYLVFRERAKQLLVLSTGKNVAPQAVEEALENRPVVEQALVLGDGEKFVGALVVPDEDALAARAEREGVSVPAESERLPDSEGARDVVKGAIQRANENLESHETVKQFELLTEEFTEDNDLLTPTMKKVRPNIKERHAERISSIYDEQAFADEERVQAAGDD
ncbi:AMP-dependent synthetase/ligase [Haloarcula amylovorans]|uniref:AMP-dependent synthetase/ligase n=1 Tax=Haloarcula amylovorans TaxID=2562280 RepID=UPI0010767617|nr:long-chain fatty acid--CoA ligase [Halomicroarcula amylolytica]